MPVDDHIQSGIDGGVHGFDQLSLTLFAVAEIAALPGVHGGAEQVCPVSRRVSDGLGVGKLRVPLETVAAHAPQHHTLAVFAAQPRPLHMEPAVLGDAAAACLDMQR